MVITKYNRGNGKYTIGSSESIAASNSSSNSNTTVTNSSGSIDCELWGNHVDGTNDVDSTMFINGSIYAIPDLFDGFDDDEDDNLPEGELKEYEGNEYEKFPDDNGGNIYAANLIKSFGDIKADKAIEADSTYGKTVYLDYPERNNKKTDLLDILKNFDGRISTNSTNISNLQTRMDTAESNITNLQTRMNKVETNISSLTTTVNNLSNTVNTCMSHCDEHGKSIEEIWIAINDLITRLNNGEFCNCDNSGPNETNYTLTVTINNGVANIKLTGTVNETITSSKTYTLSSGSIVNWTATPKSGYTIVNDSGTATINRNVTIAPEAVEELDKITVNLSESAGLTISTPGVSGCGVVDINTEYPSYGKTKVTIYPHSYKLDKGNNIYGNCIRIEVDFESMVDSNLTVSLICNNATYGWLDNSESSGINYTSETNSIFDEVNDVSRSATFSTVRNTYGKLVFYLHKPLYNGANIEINVTANDIQTVFIDSNNEEETE